MNRTEPRTTEIMCEQCGAEMVYVNGVTFACPKCQNSWSANEYIIDIIDGLMTVRSFSNGEGVEAVIRAAVDGIRVPPGADPDQYPLLGDLVDALKLPPDILFSDRIIIAWAHWRDELDQREEQSAPGTPAEATEYFPDA